MGPTTTMAWSPLQRAWHASVTAGKQAGRLAKDHRTLINLLWQAVTVEVSLAMAFLLRFDFAVPRSETWLLRTGLLIVLLASFRSSGTFGWGTEYGASRLLQT